MSSQTLSPGDDFTVPTAVYSITIMLEGEAGETDDTFGTPIGGDGGYVEGTIDVSPGETLYVRSSPGGGGVGAREGGDSIDVRQDGTSLNDRVAVAAGGGGGANFGSVGDGGEGGALTGEDGEDNPDTFSGPGLGGSQSAGGDGGDGIDGEGSPGQFGDGGDAAGGGAGAGGAGWYGGGGAGDDSGRSGECGGGGGSNYVGGIDPTNNERGGSFQDFGEGGSARFEWEPASVGTLTASTDSDTSISLNWNSPENFDPNTYYIDRSTYDGDYSQIATASTTSYTDTGLSQGAQYYYRIRADDVDPSNTDSATTTLPAPSIDEVTLE